MHTTPLLLPALAAICYGAALPQSIVTGTTISVADAGEPTFTFVIPCFPLETGCSPRTVTVEGRDTPEPTFGFGIPSESIAFGDGVTETAVILPRQSLVTGTTVSVPQETFTFVIPCYPGEKSCVPRTVTLEGRDPEPQSLGSISRSASIPPTLPTTTSTTSSKHHHSARQTLVGSPSRSVPVWPSWSTVTVTITLTTTAQPPSSTTTYSTTFLNTTTTPLDTISSTPGSKPPVTSSSSASSSASRSVNTDQGSSSTYSINTADTTGVLTERQVLGSPTRTVLEWPYPTITVTTTVYVTTTYVPPPISSLASPFPSSALSSTSDATTGTGTDVSTSLPVLTVPVKGRRQVLGRPTRSVIWY